MADGGEVKIKITGDDSQFKSVISGLENITGKGAKALASGFVKATGAAVAGLGTITAASINVGKSFESGMSTVAAISGASGKELLALSEKAKEMGATTKFSASEAAGAMEYMAMAGWKSEQMINGIEGVMKLAAASGEDLATTSDIVTDALTAFGMKAEDSGRFADVLAAASSNANTNVSMMGETFKYVAPVAGSLGYSCEDVAVGIGLMANAGIKGSQAGTALRSTLSRLTNPTKESQMAMDKLGLSITNSDGTMKSFNEVMVDMRKGFSGLSAEEKASTAAMLGGQEAMSGLLAIANASEEDFNKLTEAIANSNGEVERMANTNLDNLEGDITILKSSLEGLGIEIYEGVQEPLREAAKEATNMVGDLTKAFKNGGFSGLASEIGNVLSQIVTKIAKYTPKMIDAGVKLIQSFLNGISKNSSKIASAAVKICTALIRGLREIIPQITAIAGQIISAFANELGKAIPILTPITSIVSLIGDNLNSLIPIVVAAASSFATFQIITTVTAAVQSLIAKFQAIQTVLTAYSTAMAASTTMMSASNVASVLLVQTMKPLEVIIGVITGKISLAAAAQAAWNAIMSANPIMLIITALAALAVGIGVYVAATNKASDAELEHQKQVEASIERTNELKDSMESQKESYANSIQSTEESTAAKLSEMERTQELANELMTLADSEGNVAEKNRERVDFILGELNSAYGTEYALIDGQIQKYSELVDSINKVIEAEKAKALVSSYSSQLQEAYKNEAEAASGAKEATKELSGQYAERDRLVQEFLSSTGPWVTGIQDEKAAAEYLSTAHGNLAKRYQEVDQAIKNNEEVIRYHAEAEREVADKEAQFSEASAQLKIGNYEKITQQASLSAEQRAAIASGEGAKIKEAIQANNEEIKMLEEARNTASDESIRNYISKQIETLTSNGEILKQAFEELGKGSDESLGNGIESGGSAKNAAENKVNEVKEAFGSNFDETPFGKYHTTSFVQGVDSVNTFGTAQKKAYEAKQGFGSGGSAAPEGQAVSSTFGEGVEAGGSAAPAAASNIAQETVSAFEPINTIPESVSTSMSEVVSATSDNMSQLPTIADEKINAVKTSFDNGFAQIKTATSSAMSEVKTIISSTDLSGVGANVVQGLINGMNSKLGEVRAVAAEIAKTVAEAAKAKLDIHSPSRVFAEIGKNVMLGLVNGLEDNQYKAWYAMYNASEKLLDSERFYLKEKQRLEDEAFDKEYQEKLDNAKDSEEIEKIKQEYTAKAEEDGRDKYLEILKESSEEERRIYDDNLKAAEDSYKNILEKQKNFADKLAKQNDNLLYGTVTDSMNGFEFERSGITTTKQLKAYTASWKEYSELLDKIRNIDGLPKEVFEIFKDLNQKEGYGIAQDILKMNANGTLNEWIDAYTAATKAQADVSNHVFKDEAAELANALYDEFGEIPEEFMDFGTESADNFGKGFLNQIKTVIAGIKANVLANISSLMPTLALAGAGGNTSNTYNASYYIQPSAGESTQAQLLAIRSQEKINKYRMG